jgi:small subunit ribosomal protein S20
VANIKSQVKRIKQNEKRRQRNVKAKSSIRTASKKLVTAVESKENADAVKGLFVNLQKTIDKAAGAGVVHKKTASRKKSRLAKRVNALLKSQS